MTVQKLTNIAQGWYEFAKGSPQTKHLMLFRLSKCDKCPEKVEMDTLGKVIISTINNEASLYKCNKCGCPLASKTAAPGEACPLGKWGIAGTESMY